MKPLPSNVREAIAFLREIKFVSGKQDPATFDAMGGLYEGVFEQPGRTVNKANSKFKDDAACVQTVLEGLDTLESAVEKPGLIMLPKGTINHAEAEQKIVANTNIIDDALVVDFPEAHRAASEKIRQRVEYRRP